MSKGKTDQAISHFADMLTPTIKTFTPSTGSSYSTWGGCYYMVYGKLVIIHLAVSGITASSTITVYTMPSGLRPTHRVQAVGGAGTSITYCQGMVLTNGQVRVISPNTYAYAVICYVMA